MYNLGTFQNSHDIFAEWKVMQSLLLSIPNPVGSELAQLNHNASVSQTPISQRDVTRIQTFNRVMLATRYAAVQYLGTNSNVISSDAANIGLDCNPFQASRELFYHRLQRQAPPLCQILKNLIDNNIQQHGFSSDFESIIVLNDNWRNELQTKTHFCDLSSDIATITKPEEEQKSSLSSDKAAIIKPKEEQTSSLSSDIAIKPKEEQTSSLGFDKDEITKPNKDQTEFFEFPLKPFQTYEELVTNLREALTTYREKARKQLETKPSKQAILGTLIKINNYHSLCLFPLSDKEDIGFKKQCEAIYFIIDSAGLSLDMHSAFRLISELIVMPLSPNYPVGDAPSQLQQLTYKTVDPMPKNFEEFFQHRIFKTFKEIKLDPNLDFMVQELCKYLLSYAEFAKTIEEAFSQNGLNTQLSYIFANVLVQIEQLSVLATGGIDHKIYVRFANTMRNIFSMANIWIIITDAHDPTCFKKYEIKQVLKKNLESDLAPLEISLVRFTEYGMTALHEIRMGLRSYFKKYYGKLPKNLLDFPIYFETKKAFAEVDPFQKNNVLHDADKFQRKVKEQQASVYSDNIEHDTGSFIREVKEEATSVQSRNVESVFREIKDDEPGDCLFAEVLVPLSLDHTNYGKRDIKKQIQSKLKHAGIVCAVLDDTVQTDEIINIIKSFPKELQDKKLHLIVWQSLQKYAMLGTDVYNGGMYYVVSSDKNLVQEFTKVSEAHTVNPILEYGMCQILRTALVSEYQTRIQRNAQLFFSLIEKRHVRTSDEVRRDELLFDDTEMTFFSSMRVIPDQKPILEFFTQYVQKKLSEKKIHCVRRIGFGFSIFDFDEIENTLRITMGLEHQAMVKSIANTFNESCEKFQSVLKTIKPYLACLDGKVLERDRSTLIKEFLESWLESGHDVYRIDLVEKTLFCVATKLGHTELMKQLVANLPDRDRAAKLEIWFQPNTDGMNPLHLAAKNNQKDSMVLLIELQTQYKFKMDVNAFDKNGSTPLLYAVDTSNDTTIFRTDINAYGNKAPVAAVDKSDDTAILDLLIQAGADVNRFNQQGGFNALLTAIIRENENIIKFLLKQQKLNVNAINQKGETLMHTAALIGNIDVLDTLKSIGVAIDTPDLAGATPLMVAVKSQELESIDWFLKHGADNTKVDNQGNSAKSLGLASGNGEVQALFENKAKGEEAAV